MANIKTKRSDKDIKFFNKRSFVGERMKSAYIKAKNNAQNLTDDGQLSPTEYAENNIRNAITDTVKDTAKVTTKTLKRSIKSTHRAIKTAKQTKKATIKTSKAAKGTAKASAKVAKVAYQSAKAVAKATIVTAKAIAKATVTATKAIIEGTKALVAAIAAGGWVAVVIIIIICLIALFAACFGIFFSGEDTGTGITMQTAVSEINTEYQNKVDELINTSSHDAIEISGLSPIWKDILATYATKINFNPEAPQEVVTMDDNKITLLKEVFWDMTDISSTLASKTVSVPIETVDENGNISVTYTNETKNILYITVSHKTPSEMADTYRFTTAQKEILTELLSQNYDNLWQSALYGISGGSKKIISVAALQLGNNGGQPFWSWYGFNSRVEWCACFVSWCANECGYIDAGIIPKFASCDVGMTWFKEHNRWQPKTYIPKEGDIIFFDWDNDGFANHVGIVEKAEDGKIYTIEGNSGDACKKLIYTSDNQQVLGFGIPAY